MYTDEAYGPRTNFDVNWWFFHVTFINLRFIGLFSLLFGLGMAIQEHNRIKLGQNFGAYYCRRSMVLAGFGLFNTTFLFEAEILLVYAIFGLAAYWLVRLNAKLAFAVALISFMAWGSYFELTHRDALIEAIHAPLQEGYTNEKVRSIYTGGPLTEAIKLRWKQYAMIYADNGFHLGISFALIIIGYLIGTKRWHTRFLENLSWHKRYFGLATAYTIAFAVYAISGHHDFFIPTDGVIRFIAYKLFLIFSLYVYTFAIAYVVHAWGAKNPLIAILSNNGRMSLTGYVGGAMIYAIIFHWPGFGLHMRFGGAATLVIALSCYAAFSAFAWLWLKRFPQGPLETIYRGLSGSSST